MSIDECQPTFHSDICGTITFLNHKITLKLVSFDNVFRVYLSAIPTQLSPT